MNRHFLCPILWINNFTSFPLLAQTVLTHQFYKISSSTYSVFTSPVCWSDILDVCWTIFELCTIFCHAALSLHHPRITVLTGSELWCKKHIMLLKRLAHVTNLFAGSSFWCCCHCKLTFPMNRIWLTESSPSIAHYSYYECYQSAAEVQNAWLTQTLQAIRPYLLNILHAWWSKNINTVVYLCYSAEQLDAVCGTGSSQQPNLKHHVCNVCHKTFAKKDKLTRHNRSHTGEKPFRCDVCGRCFADSGDLSKHRRIHTGDKQFLCEFCSKGFYRHGDLVIHSRAHTGEKPYKCELCSQHFCRRGDLSSHHRTHSGEKPFKCEYCGKYFSRSGHLVLHNRTHTGYKPYICEICTKDFCSKGELVVHQRTHTGEKPYKCDICCKYFSYPGAFSKHRRIHV